MVLNVFTQHPLMGCQAAKDATEAETHRNGSQTGIWVTVLVVALACGVSLVGVATRQRSGEHQQRNPKRQLIVNDCFEQEMVSGGDAEASLTSPSFSNPGSSLPAPGADKQTTSQLNMPIQPLHYLRNGKARASAHPQDQVVPHPIPVFMESAVSPQSNPEDGVPNVLSTASIRSLLEQTEEQMPKGSLKAVRPRPPPFRQQVASLGDAQDIRIDDADINSLELSLPHSSADRERDSVDALLERPAKNLDFLFSDNASQIQGNFPPGMKVLLETCCQDSGMMVSALFAATKM